MPICYFLPDGIYTGDITDMFPLLTIRSPPFSCLGKCHSTVIFLTGVWSKPLKSMAHPASFLQFINKNRLDPNYCDFGVGLCCLPPKSHLRISRTSRSACSIAPLVVVSWNHFHTLWLVGWHAHSIRSTPSCHVCHNMHNVLTVEA